ncbi:MAG: nitrous oxide reductase family maturation protein NosD [Planctomycetota bacterium JB042]
MIRNHPFLAAVALSLSALPLGEAATLHVPAQYATIQAAIDAASSGDTVQVAPGVYVETLTLKSGLALKGAGWKTTVVDGDQQGNVISVTNANVSSFSIEGFTIRNSDQSGSGFSNNGIFINGAACCSVVSNATIRECRIEHCGRGICIKNVHGGTITIERNQIVDILYVGVDPYLGATVIRNNTIVGCGTAGYYDHSGGGGGNLLENNIVAFNGTYGIRTHAQTPMVVRYNDVYGNGTDYFQSSGAGSGWNPSGTNVSIDPTFVDLSGDDVHLAPGTAMIDLGNPATQDPDGSIADLGALPYDGGYVPPSLTPFGAACGGLAFTASGTPWVASVGLVELGLSGAPPSAPVFLLAGPSGFPWGGLSFPYAFGPDAPGCFLNAPPVLVFGLAADASGALSFVAAIPDDPTLVGIPIDLQWAASSPGANPIAYVFSNGMRLVVGD